MDSERPSAPVRPFASVFILVQGFILILGALSSLFAARFGWGAHWQIAAEDVQFAYMWAGAGAVVGALPLLALLRARKAWPFQQRPPDWAPPRVQFLGSLGLGGLGVGLYMGLLDGVVWFGLHLPGAMAVIVLIPVSLFVVAFSLSTLRALAGAAIFLVGVAFGVRGGLLYLGGGNVGDLDEAAAVILRLGGLLGLIFVGATAGVRRLRRKERRRFA